MDDISGMENFPSMRRSQHEVVLVARVDNMENPVSRWGGFFVVCRFASLALNLRTIHGEYTEYTIHICQMFISPKNTVISSICIMYYVEHVPHYQSAN